MNRILLAAVGGAACWMATAAFAIQVPIQFSITNAVRNEFGDLVPGTSSQSPAFGVPYVQGGLVQVLNVSAGVFPPDTNGVPHPSNTVLLTTYIGAGVNPTLPESGKSSATIGAISRSDPAATNQWIVLRVFNKPTLEDASFYGQSPPYRVPVYGEGYGALYTSVSNTVTQIDTNDVDGDGLSRSWEKSHGTDPGNPDSDEDGMIDGHEIRAGTGPTDNSSLLLVVQINPPTDGGNWDEDAGMYTARPTDLNVSWDAVAGKTYQLQYTTNSLVNEPVFTDINPPVTASGPVANTIITNGLLMDIVHMRVRLVE